MSKQYCQGCGAKIQTKNPEEYGYVPEAQLERRPLLCQRCFRLNHYGLDEIGPVKAHDSLASIRSGLNWSTGVVLVVDLMDFEASLPKELLEIIGERQTILAVNKGDLLPEQTPIKEIHRWVEKRLRDLSLPKARVHLISAVNGYGFPELADGVEKLGPNVLFVGVTNVGKSSVLQRLLQMRIGGGKRHKVKPTISPYPGTTVQVSRWECPGGLILADSPGYVPQGRVSDLVAVECARELIPHRQLSSHLYPVQVGDLIHIPGLCGIECMDSAGQGLLLGFTGSGVRWHKSTIKHLDKWLYKYEGLCQVQNWGQKVIKLVPGQDAVISGLGWVSARKATFKLRVYLPQDVQLTIRPNLIGQKKF